MEDRTAEKRIEKLRVGRTLGGSRSFSLPRPEWRDGCDRHRHHPIADYRKHGFGRGACILKSTGGTDRLCRFEYAVLGGRRMDCIARWESGKHLGKVRIKYLEELGEVDVACRFLPKHWGQGLATEAAFASVRYGFDNLGLK